MWCYNEDCPAVASAAGAAHVTVSTVPLLMIILLLRSQRYTILFLSVVLFAAVALMMLQFWLYRFSLFCATIKPRLLFFFYHFFYPFCDSSLLVGAIISVNLWDDTPSSFFVLYHYFKVCTIIVFVLLNYCC